MSHVVAGIDCGTNSVRLLVAEIGPDGRLADLAREMRIVRLGQGVDRTGRLAPEAIERTRLALVEYAGLISQHHAETIRMVATSATRDAENRADFTDMVVSVLGISPEVIAGSAEAELSFRGAAGGIGPVTAPLLVADVGGGSTELVLGDPSDEQVKLQARSMDIGCVRMTERHLRADPPTAAQVDAARRDIVAAIDQARADVPIELAATVVGVAGTVTTMAALLLKLDEYDAAAIHGSTMTADQIHELTDRLLAMTHDERAALPVMHPGRVDVIGGGALVVSELVRASGVDAVIASEHDILDAVAATARQQVRIPGASS
jgi:exopolyphosphatase/guanosine-5'-triphosphate,3'-diphosphate pyrophosphatase